MMEMIKNGITTRWIVDRANANDPAGLQTQQSHRKCTEPKPLAAELLLNNL